MIVFTQSIDDLSAGMLDGFFVGWPNPPSSEAHMRILSGSYCFWAAIDDEKGRAAGFITAISDGIISAYIPLLEVLPEYQRVGIGKELVSRMLRSLNGLYMIDLLCDESLQGYYKQFGMKAANGAFIRNYERQSCE